MYCPEVGNFVLTSPPVVSGAKRFFVSSNGMQGCGFRTIAHGGPKEAEETLAAAERRYERKHENMR